jgi:protein subunit release factor A
VVGQRTLNPLTVVRIHPPQPTSTLRKDPSLTRKPLFSLTAKDFEFQTFCTGGKGGQHRNAKQNGVRCIHKASGAVGEHRDGREQYLNKREAFRKCAESAEFRKWHTVEVMKRLDVGRDIERRIDEMMKPEYLKVEEF